MTSKRAKKTSARVPAGGRTASRSGKKAATPSKAKAKTEGTASPPEKASAGRATGKAAATPSTQKKSAKKSAKQPSRPRDAEVARPDDMSPEVLEFITAIDDYKRHNERPFPNWSEILEVLLGLGYRKAS
jgi:hypothetical protein